MDDFDGFSIPKLVGASNYGQWKLRMKKHLDVYDKGLWMSIENGWTPPLSNPIDWTDQEKKENWRNKRALIALKAAMGI